MRFEPTNREEVHIVLTLEEATELLPRLETDTWRHRELRAAIEQTRRDSEPPARPRCSGCGNEIDPDTCWCGSPADRHGYGDGHSPVPMGCTCGSGHSAFCRDCEHEVAAHEDGACVLCQERLDSFPGGAQGAHVSACPSLRGGAS